MEFLHQVRERTNERNKDEMFLTGIHMPILNLKTEYKKTQKSNKCLFKDVSQPTTSSSTFEVPYYPQPVEFHVSRIAHVTTEKGLDGILHCSGFKGGEGSRLLWWWPMIGENEISDAEQRYLDNIFPDRSQEERDRQKPFLHNFTTSPLFKDSSRFGNFRFTFTLADVLQKYRETLCGGKDPVFRVYETVIYKQGIMYSVMIHSPDVHDYDDYPVLGDNDDGVCAYRDGEIIWRAQAISETHKFRLIENSDEKQVHVTESHMEFYVWDHVTPVFHIPEDNILEFSEESLLEALTACSGDFPFLNDVISLENAREIVEQKKN